MPRFAANLTTMFRELPIGERFDAASEMGFRAAEYLFPYQHSVPELAGWLDRSELELILVNTSPGDREAGERGLAALPGREADFADAFQRALAYIIQLKGQMIHVMAGVVPEHTDPAPYESTFIDNLKTAADQAARANVRLLLEPLNAVDVPGYLHSTAEQTCRLIDQIGRDNVQLQYDFYHLQISQGNLGAGLRRYFDRIGHVQFSSVPGRHEPEYGEVNLPHLFNLLDELGYGGWVGCEYSAKINTREGLTWGTNWGLGPR